MLHGYTQLYGLHKNRTHLRMKDIAKDVEKRYDTSNCELERPLPREKK